MSTNLLKVVKLANIVKSHVTSLYGLLHIVYENFVALLFQLGNYVALLFGIL